MYRQCLTDLYLVYPIIVNYFNTRFVHNLPITTDFNKTVAQIRSNLQSIATYKTMVCSCMQQHIIIGIFAVILFVLTHSHQMQCISCRGKKKTDTSYTNSNTSIFCLFVRKQISITLVRLSMVVKLKPKVILIMCIFFIYKNKKINFVANCVKDCTVDGSRYIGSDLKIVRICSLEFLLLFFCCCLHFVQDLFHRLFAFWIKCSW